MSSADPLTQPTQPARYDLLAVNLTLAVISALVMAAVGGSVKVVELLEKTEISRGIKTRFGSRRSSQSRQS